MPSVNVMQPIEPRLPAPPTAPSRGGEPFAELLDSAVTTHHEPRQPDAFGTHIPLKGADGLACARRDTRAAATEQDGGEG